MHALFGNIHNKEYDYEGDGTINPALLERNCFQCPFYVHYDEAAEDKRVSKIEESIAFGLEEYFPYKWLEKNEAMAIYDCKKRLGLKDK